MTTPNTRTPLDPYELRRAFGAFATGVTIVTTADGNGGVFGFTANSFTSVSIDPPLVLVSISKASYGLPIFTRASGFAVNILAEHQRALSNQFATRGSDKFAGTSWHSAQSGSPIFEHVVAWFDCEYFQQVDAGDHKLLIGKVLEFGYNYDTPLGFCRGAYVSFGLTPQMLQLVSSKGRLQVGALIEKDNKILLQVERDPDRVRIPIADRVGDANDPGSLLGMLASAGIETQLPFLFSAYHMSDTRYVYYRGELKSAVATDTDSPTLRFFEFDDIPWSSVRDYAVKRILKRYLAERSIGNYSVYIGGKNMGTVYDED